MNFQSDNDVDYDGFSTPTLPPGKYIGAELTSVKLERPTNSEGEPLKRRIIFVFRTAEGSNHTRIEYDIDPDDPKAESKSTNLVKRIGHIMSKYVSKEALVQNNTSFSDYGKWVLSTLEEKYKGVKIDFIIVGNVYNGKATADFPGYPPFIVKSGDSLGFDNNHNRSNKEYDIFIASASQAPTDSEPASTPVTQGDGSVVTEGEAAVNTSDPDF